MAAAASWRRHGPKVKSRPAVTGPKVKSKPAQPAAPVVVPAGEVQQPQPSDRPSWAANMITPKARDERLLETLASAIHERDVLEAEHQMRRVEEAAARREEARKLKRSLGG